jgi:hypothetical protein
MALLHEGDCCPPHFELFDDVYTEVAAARRLQFPSQHVVSTFYLSPEVHDRAAALNFDNSSWRSLMSAAQTV